MLKQMNLGLHATFDANPFVCEHPDQFFESKKVNRTENGVGKEKKAKVTHFCVKGVEWK